MVILFDMALCRVNLNNGIITEECKLPMRKNHEYASQFEMDLALNRFERRYFPGKRINASFKTIKIGQSTELQNLMDEIGAWSNKTFDNGNHTPKRSISISYHLQKEAKELTEALERYFANPSQANKDAVRKEIADVTTLLLDSGSKFGMTARQIILEGFKKLEINKKRTWGQPDQNGVVEHIRD